MNLRTLMVALGALGILGFTAACEIKEGTGAGGEGGAGVGGTGGGGGEGGTAGGGGEGGTGGTGGAAACYDKNPGCGEYITPDPGTELPDWCDEDPNYTPGSTNPSYDLYDALSNCTCDLDGNPATNAPCAEVCKDEACAGKDTVVGGECQKCIVDTNMGCGKEFNACASDI